MGAELSRETWVIVALGIIQGAAVFPVWNLTFLRLMRGVSFELADARSKFRAIFAAAIACLACGLILLGPLYIFGLVPSKEDGAVWGYAWVGSAAVIGILGLITGWFRELYRRGAQNRRA